MTKNDGSSSPSQAMKLVLEDGTEMRGSSIGAVKAVAGEVVFNTGMTGYVETLTDPSYRGQILVLTYPLVGNYGVPSPRPKGSIDRPYESDRMQVQGLVVQQYVDQYSHHAATRSLSQWLKTENVSAVTGIDTRTLTRLLRESGTMKGWLFPETMELNEVKNQADAIDMQHQVFRDVAPQEPVSYGDGDLTILLIDAGAKDNIVRSLVQRGVKVLRIPWHAQLSDFTDRADGIVLGNGPGNPKDLGTLIEQLRTLLTHFEKPILGICLGNQILALAAGADTYKLPYGHRGVNQPVQDLLTRRCYVTSQNHGYAVKDDSLPPGWEPWFVNINDGTNEGIRSRFRPWFSIQFHPESHPGPRDTNFLFDDYLRLVGAMIRR